MVESIEKAKGIEYLPILYTPEMVLLPFENQSLKIQTAAHKQMIKDAAHETRFFGVNFLDKKTAASELPEIGSVGCVAELKRIRLSATGGKIADVTGVVRYQIEGYRTDCDDVPYPVAEALFVEDEPEDEEMLRELTREAGSVISRIFDKALKDKKKSGDEPLASIEPRLASFLLADLFNMDNASRQLFLQLRLTSERLKACQENLLRIEDGTDKRITREQFMKPFYTSKHK